MEETNAIKVFFPECENCIHNEICIRKNTVKQTILVVQNEIDNFFKKDPINADFSGLTLDMKCDHYYDKTNLGLIRSGKIQSSDIIKESLIRNLNGIH